MNAIAGIFNLATNFHRSWLPRILTSAGSGVHQIHFDDPACASYTLTGGGNHVDFLIVRHNNSLFLFYNSTRGRVINTDDIVIVTNVNVHPFQQQSATVPPAYLLMPVGEVLHGQQKKLCSLGFMVSASEMARSRIHVRG